MIGQVVTVGNGLVGLEITGIIVLVVIVVGRSWFVIVVVLDFRLVVVMIIHFRLVVVIMIIPILHGRDTVGRIRAVIVIKGRTVKFVVVGNGTVVFFGEDE